MKTKPLSQLCLGAVLAASVVTPTIASDVVPAKGDIKAPAKSYSPYVGVTYPKNVYWGDTHLHTSNSFDAGFVNFRVGPEEAFRFASGEEVQASNGMQVKLVRPLDFLVVTDHAEYLGLAPRLTPIRPAAFENRGRKALARHAEKW